MLLIFNLAVQRSNLSLSGWETKGGTRGSRGLHTKLESQKNLWFANWRMCSSVASKVQIILHGFKWQEREGGCGRTRKRTLHDAFPRAMPPPTVLIFSLFTPALCFFRGEQLHHRATDNQLEIKAECHFCCCWCRCTQGRLLKAPQRAQKQLIRMHLTIFWNVFYLQPISNVRSTELKV